VNLKLYRLFEVLDVVDDFIMTISMFVNILGGVFVRSIGDDFDGVCMY